jgi:hypothetical protein
MARRRRRQPSDRILNRRPIEIVTAQEFIEKYGGSLPGISGGAITIILNRNTMSYMWVQRDLEDLIAEEKAALESAKNKKSNMARQVKEIKIPEILGLLAKGYVRYKKDDEGFGSIQEHYELTGVEVAEVFRHPKLKGVKTKFPSRIKLIDEPEAPEQPQTIETEQPKADDVFD